MSIRSLTVALMSGVALAATQLPAVAATDFVAKQAAGESSSSGLIGTKIQNSANENIGDVNYLVLDENGSVTTVVIGVGGFLGVGEKNVGVPYKSVTREVDKDGNAVFKLNATKEELSAAPAYEWTEKGTLQKAADTVKEKTEGMTRADDPAPATTGTSEGASGSMSADTPPAATPPADSKPADSK
jgi:sporulation protein YlmC with PRC-barrel domain